MELRKYDSELENGCFDFLDLIMLDIYGNMRHVSIPKGYVSEKLFKEGIGFDASNFGYAKVTNSDMVSLPDMTTAFVEVNLEHVIVHCFCDVKTTDGNSFAQYPRTIAQKTIEHLNTQKIADTCKMLVELEFYVFDDVNYATDFGHSYYKIQSEEGIGPEYYDQPRFGIHKGYFRMHPEDKYYTFRNEVVKTMEAVGIPVKYHHHEVGAAQLEIELNFLPLVEAGDAVTLSKWIIKNIASELGIHVTFMPKPIYKLAGSGLHVHQFLEKDGKSLFTGDELHNLSKAGLNYIAGILEHSLTGSLLALTNPSTNSYKRLVPGYEAPIGATFAKGSRSAAIRIPGYLKKGDVRMEFRTGDATANVYYALSAMILAGVDGIKRGADPIALGFSNPDHDTEKTFPLSLNLVLDGLEKDCEYLTAVFPKELLTLWSKIKRDEATYVYNAPTPQEYELYF